MIKPKRYIAVGALVGLIFFLLAQLTVLLTGKSTLAPFVFPAYPPEIGAPEIRGLLAAGPLLLVCIALGVLAGTIALTIARHKERRRSS